MRKLRHREITQIYQLVNGGAGIWIHAIWFWDWDPQYVTEPLLRELFSEESLDSPEAYYVKVPPCVPLSISLCRKPLLTIWYRTLQLFVLICKCWFANLQVFKKISTFSFKVIFKFFYLLILEREEWERYRNTDLFYFIYLFIKIYCYCWKYYRCFSPGPPQLTPSTNVPLIYIFIGWFLYVPW